MNSFGRVFRIHLHGESHGREIGVTIDGCPAGLPLSVEDFSADLQRRRSGAPGTTKRREADVPEIRSGICQGRTSGAPLLISFSNQDARSEDYLSSSAIPRPGHADFAAGKKFGGFHDRRGGGMFSGRLTLGLVAAGVVAKKIIVPLRLQARLLEAGGSRHIEKTVEQALKSNDSLGGLLECRAFRVPAGLGEPFFDSLESLIAHLVFAVPGIKGIEFGTGFRSAAMTGSAYNDLILNRGGKTRTNHSGGCNGGISNGNQLLFRAAARPTASIGLGQLTYNPITGLREELRLAGRHDTCFALRLPVVLEAVSAVVLADLLILAGRIKPVWRKK